MVIGPNFVSDGDKSAEGTHGKNKMQVGDVPEIVVSWSGMMDETDWYSKIYFTCPRCQSRHAMLVHGDGKKPDSVLVQCKAKLGSVKAIFRT